MKRVLTVIVTGLALSAGNARAQKLSVALKTEAVKSLAKAARERGDAVRGAIVFHQKQSACVKCHLPNAGNLLGPDLTRMGKQATDEYLVESILYPSKAIKKGFETITIASTAGKVFTGRLIKRSPRELVLRLATETAKLLTLATTDIETLVTNKKSGMPDELVDQLKSRQEFLDLVKYLMTVAETGPSVYANQVAGGGTLRTDLQGLVLLDHLNCIACHSDGSNKTGNQRGPNLAWAAGRIDPAYIERFVNHPSAVKLGTTMPGMLADLKAVPRSQIANALTHYIISLNPKSFHKQAPDRIAAKRGRDLFHSVGCVACHSPRDDKGNELLAGKSVPLGKLEEKYNIDGLIEFLKNPHAVRPAGRMPNMKLSHWETGEIAHYLLRNTKVAGRLGYTLYRGKMHEGFNRLAGKETTAGLVDGFTIAPFTKTGDDYAVVFEGFLKITQPGNYVFSLNCNDGGRLSIDGKPLISLPAKPDAKTQSATATITLTTGQHAIRLSYVHIRGKSLLNLQLAGPSLKQGPIPQKMLNSEKNPVEPSRPFVLNQALARTGKTLFARLDCAKCHASELPEEKRNHPPLARLRSDRGCLSGKPGDWPRYQLKESQRDALRKAIKRKSTQLSDEEQIQVTLTRLNCVACHQRGKLGGVSPERMDHFLTTDQNLGRQGHIPPTLTGVGAKLKPQWMRDVLVSGKTIRPYMKTRMPQYGAPHVGRLVDLFQRVDQLLKAKIPKFSDQKLMRQTGLELTGNRGLNCVACHTYRLKRSATMPAVDLTDMAERLQEDWFFHYMRDPQRFSLNTVMPSFWPGGRAIRKNVLAGNSDMQIAALWEYLLDGRQGRTPRGLINEPLEIVVGDEAVMLRRQYKGIGKRGIGVGYPGRVNIAFDAEQMRLAMIWKGKFVDPGSAFRGQGSGSVRPLGDDLIQFARGPELDDATKPWIVDDGRPPLHRFQGYSLDAKQRPILKYRFDNIDVEDYPVDVKAKKTGATILRRTLTFQSAKGRTNVVFRAAVHKSIVSEGRGVFRVGDNLRIRVVGKWKAQIRKTVAGNELRIPFDVAVGTSQLILEYVW